MKDITDTTADAERKETRALTVRERAVPSGDGFGRLRRRSSRTFYEVESGGRVLATWPTLSDARRHAQGLPVVERRGGLFIVWLGSRRVELTKADFERGRALAA